MGRVRLGGRNAVRLVGRGDAGKAVSPAASVPWDAQQSQGTAESKGTTLTADETRTSGFTHPRGTKGKCPAHPCANNTLSACPSFSHPLLDGQSRLHLVVGSFC